MRQQWKTALLICLIFSLIGASVSATSQKIDISSTKKMVDVWDAPHEIQITTVRKVQSKSNGDISESKDIFVLTVKIVTDDILLQSWLNGLLNIDGLESREVPKAYLMSTVHSPVFDMRSLIYEQAASFFQVNASTWLINVPMQNLCAWLSHSGAHPAYEVCIEGSFTFENIGINEIHCLNMSDKNVTFDKGTMAFTPHARRNGNDSAESPLIGNMHDVCSTLHKINPNIYGINFEKSVIVHPLQVK